MKTIFGFLATLTVLCSFATPAFSGVISASPSRVQCQSTPVLTSAWTVLNTSIPKAIKAVSISNTGGVPVVIGLAPASGAANTEIGQLVIPASVTLQIVPMVASQNQRISVIALNASCSTGEIQANFLYN